MTPSFLNWLIIANLVMIAVNAGCATVYIILIRRQRRQQDSERQAP
jgi:hypothetical protein